MVPRAVDTLASHLEVRLDGLIDIRYKGLRIAVDERKPSALHLNHDAVSGLECVIAPAEPNGIESHLAGRNRYRLFKTASIASAKNLFGNHEFKASHIRGLHAVRVHVNELHDPVAISSCRCR